MTRGPGDYIEDSSTGADAISGLLTASGRHAAGPDDLLRRALIAKANYQAALQTARAIKQLSLANFLG